jgi:thiol:disulfide interchange protein DsbD
MRVTPNCRWTAPFALAAFLAMAFASPAARAVADEPKPAKKDSRPATRPREAKFTTSVSPSEAKPGDTVTYKVKVKLDAPWHIYKYSKVQAENGPKYTEFDFFDTAGLKLDGDWTPSDEPIKKKEPAFPDLPFLEYHEEEVTWSVTLKVPADARPGRKTLRCQAGYMICSDQNCSFPGQWTLPDSTVTIVTGPKLAARSMIAAASLVSLQAPVDGPKPKEPDSRPRARPKAASFTTSISPATASPGQTVELKVTAKVDAPWHIYKYSKDQPDDGPRLTSFDLFDPAGLVPQGGWTPATPPIKKKDNSFPNLEFLEFYEGEASWAISLQIPNGTAPGKKAVRVQINYMICNDGNCSQPIFWTLPDAELTVAEGVAVAVAAPPSPAPTVTPAPAPVVKETAPTVAAVPADSAPPADVAGKAKEGLLPFLMFCAAGGLFALAMPCVWPMIPVTVNFFVKQGQKKEGSTTGLALAYCLSIILIFVAVGLAFAVAFGPASLSKLANSMWLNFAVAGIFFAFGLSLLGLFEIRLPNFLLNASSQGESKGGLVGVMFMALTLTITSFTCTFPVVGGLLVIAAGGDLLYPVLGLATFASVLALPFFLLALSPGLLAKMPKSGDWMNTVKVVGGLIEIGAAFKFINTAECTLVVPSEAWFNAYTVLAIWTVMLLICGIYLLGLFRTDHDYEEIKVGPGRIISGWLFLSLALFLAPALFGRPPESKIWYLVAGLLPADAADLRAPVGGGGGEQLAKIATSDDPKTAEREQTSFHGVAWGMSYDAALEKAKASGKPVLIDFTGVNCANCRIMELEVFPRPEVVQSLADFVTVQLYTDSVPIKSIPTKERLKLAEANLDLEIKLFDDITNPNYVIVDPEGKILGKIGGKRPWGEFVGFLKGALDRFKASGKVAQGG